LSEAGVDAVPERESFSMTRPFRFGGGLFTATSAAEWAEKARRLEAAGYDTLFTGDHFAPFLAPVPALLAAAMATTRLRVSCTVFDNDFHHPAALAKEVATADMLSGGRFEFGIGAGWNKVSYDRGGVPFDPPPVRVARFEEATRIIKGLWADGPLSFAGTYYTIADYEGLPKPLQRPHPPIFIGGGGRRLLSFAAREADIVGIAPRAKPAGDGLDSSEEPDECVAQKVEWVRQAAGARFDDLEFALLLSAVAVTDNRDASQAAAERIAQRTSRRVEDVFASHRICIGSVDAIVEKLLEQRERHGFSYVSVFPQDTDAFAPVVARLAGK
jgi:probable F420-dependent oxidoreductase